MYDAWMVESTSGEGFAEFAIQVVCNRSFVVNPAKSLLVELSIGGSTAPNPENDAQQVVCSSKTRRIKHAPLNCWILPRFGEHSSTWGLDKRLYAITPINQARHDYNCCERIKSVFCEFILSISFSILIHASCIA